MIDEIEFYQNLLNLQNKYYAEFNTSNHIFKYYSFLCMSDLFIFSRIYDKFNSINSFLFD